MARAWITDRWLTPDASASAKRSLNAVKDPLNAKVPDEYRKHDYGTGSRWRVDWYAIDPKTNTKKRLARSFTKLQDAEEYRDAVADDLRSGKYIDPKTRAKTFTEVADEWIKSKNKVKQVTKDRLERELKIYITPKWGDSPISAITEAGINEWIGQLRDGKAPTDFDTDHKAPKLAAGTIRHIVGVTFGSVLRYAAKPSRRWLSINPLDDVKLPKSTEAKIRVYLKYPEVEALANTAGEVGSEQDALIVRTLAYTGLRVNELLSLRDQDVNLSERRLIVSHSWTRIKGGGQKLGTTKTGKTRRVPIPKFLIEDLKKQINSRDDDAWLFVNSEGGHLSDANWRHRVWVPSVQGTGLDMPGLTIHSLRHTYASLSIDAGVSVKTLQSAMGHASAVETLDTYSDLWPERLDELTDAIGERREKALEEAKEVHREKS
jgi:integrase